MKSYQYKISLRLRHPSADPADITSALGLEPKHSWRAGEPRRTPKGNPLEGTNPATYWVASLAEGRWPGKGLPAAVSALLDQIASHKDFFHRIRAEGGRVELFVGWFFDSSSGDIFDFELMGRMAELEIDISLAVYPPDQEMDPATPP